MIKSSNKNVRSILFAFTLMLNLAFSQLSLAQLQTVSISGYSGPICNGKSVTLCAPSGYDTYLWNNGATTKCLTAFTPGTYSVTVSILNSRVGSNVKTTGFGSILVEALPPPPCVISGVTNICQGASTTFTATGGFVSYQWSTGATTQSIVVSVPGIYTVTATNSDGCKAVVSKTLNIIPTPIVTFNGATGICQGETATICASAGYTSYTWNTGQTTDCIETQNAGTYTVVVTNTAGCSSSASQTISAASNPSCTITGSNGSVCAGQSASLCLPSGYSAYEWSTGETTNCISVSTGNVYSVKVTNSAGCTSTCTQTINVVPIQPITITGTNGTICQGTTPICATGGFSSYSWSSGQNTQCIPVDAAGTYTVTATGQAGCQSSASINISVAPPVPSAISGDATICQGESTQLCAPHGFDEYLWSTGATTKCINVNTPGLVTLTVTRYINSSPTERCSSTSNLNVVIHQPPPSTITWNETLCANGTTTLCAPSGYSGYLWSNGQTSSCINVGQAGTYSVRVTNSNGCQSTSSQSVSINTITLNISGGESQLCYGQTATLCATNGFTSYSWSNGSTSPCITVNTPGNYTVTVTDSKGCTASKTRIITGNPNSIAITGVNNPVCAGTTVHMCASPGFSSYLWNTGQTTSCIDVSAPGVYTVNVTGSQSSCPSSASQEVIMNSQTVCLISGNNGPICSGQTANLCAPDGFANYLWSNGQTTKCIQTGTPGNYSVTVSNSEGCSSTCFTNLTVNNPPPCAITGYTGPLCAGQSTTLCAPTGYTTYSWNTGETTRCITTSLAGTYTVTFSGSNNENNFGCQSSCSQVVEVSWPQSCTITSNANFICSGDAAQLCVPSGFTSYLWNNGATTECITSYTGGEYSVTATAPGGCTYTCSKNVVLIPPSPFIISGSNSICQSSTAQICAPPGMAAYSWNTGETAACITVSNVGTYTCKITDQNGCTTTTSKVMSASLPPVCTITGNTNICSTGSTQLCAPLGMSKYTWNNGPVTDDGCFTVSSPGLYTVVITNAEGCSSVCSQTVDANLPPITITGNSAICEGTSTQICAPAGLSNYIWNTGATTKCITATTTGTYTVTATSSTGCTGTGSVNIADYPCKVSLTKSPSVCEIIKGTPTPVEFTYVITNSGGNFPASGTLTDDNGTFATTGDDITIGNWGPLQPGQSQTFKKTFTVSDNYTNVAVARGSSGGTTVSTTASATVTGLNCACDLAYPDNSNLPRSAVIFNESEVLRASDPGPSTCGTTGSVIKLWYNDEHALTLGVRQVNVKTSTGTVTTNYPITMTPTTATCVTNPLVGTTIATGDQSGNDIAAGGGRPLWPALFITDLSVNGSGSRAGDWQQGGTAMPPSRVCGTWKGAVRTINKTKNPPTVTVTPDANPPKNNWNIANGDVPPGGFAQYSNEGYGAEVSWNVNDLGLIPGHTYRLQFMVHDGDQNKTGGDCGEACTTIHIPGSNCSSTLTLGNTVWSDANGNGIKESAETGIANVTVNLYADNNNDDNADGPVLFSTKTDATGKYKFSALDEGNYIVGVNIPIGTTLNTINGGDPDNDTDNDNNGVVVVGGEVRSKSVTLSLGNEPIVDNDDAITNSTVDFGFKPNTPQTLQKCYVGAQHNYVTASQNWTVDMVAQTVTIKTTFSKNFVDNTYGNNTINWPVNHPFSSLTGSDRLQLALFDANNNKKMEFNMDYLSPSSSVASGFKSLGVSGGEGGMILGTASDIISVKTSLDKNLNDYGYVLTNNSPNTDKTYKVNNNYPNWIYDVWYEVTVKLTAFPNGFGEPSIVNVHASPSKTGSNEETMTDINCGSARVRATDIEAPQSRSINAYAYPNPSTGNVFISFERTNEDAVTKVEVFTVDGRNVTTLFNETTKPNVLYKVEFNTEAVEKGIYIYKITSGESSINGKIMLIK